MRKFEKKNNIRRENGKILFRELSELEGIDPPEYHPDTERDIYYLVCLRYDREKWDGIPRKNVLKAIQAEGIPVSGGYVYPLYKNPMFQNIDFDSPSSPYRLGRKRALRNYLDYKQDCPVAEYVCAEGTIWLTNELLLGSIEDTRDIIRAFKKVFKNRNEIK